VFGFAVIWHIMWLIPIGLIGAIVTIIIRSTDEDTEYTITAAEVAHTEKTNQERYA
jgi:cytochrome o ubiquinol oxidase subunit 1